MTRRTLLWAAIALAVLVVELGATIASTTGEPFAPVEDWGQTRPADTLTFVTVVLGCAALTLFNRFPITVTAIATGCYVVFALLDHELGMFLPPMIAIFGTAVQARTRLAAVACAATSLLAALIWVSARVAPLSEPGVALLAWVAFGSVLTAFFVAPLLLGEIVRLRFMLSGTRASELQRGR